MNNPSNQHIVDRFRRQNLRRVGTITLVGLLILLIGPVLLAQFRDPQERQLSGISLQDVSYQEVTFRNAEQDLALSGMLFVPEGKEPFPAAVIIHGSGTSQRDNIWYLTLAEYLQKQGVVVLLPDKRGSGHSEGDWRTASFQELAADTTAAVDYLQDQEELEISYLGVIGLSQGGQIAPLAAGMSPQVDYVVNIVGGAVPMHQSLVYEENHNLRELGVLPGFSNVLAYPAAWSIIYLRQADFWDAVGNFDPVPYWEDLAVRALILYGEEDTNVPSARSAARLASLNNPNLTVKIYPGSGHALESPPEEGSSIFRPAALEDILNFIQSVAEPD